eukprot:9474784-Pyramimonas_sp.AAC.1
MYKALKASAPPSVVGHTERLTGGRTHADPHEEGCSRAERTGYALISFLPILGYSSRSAETSMRTALIKSPELDLSNNGVFAMSALREPGSHGLPRTSTDGNCPLEHTLKTHDTISSNLWIVWDPRHPHLHIMTPR